MIIRYVNTASTSGGDGTTNNTTGSTRAYARLADALVPFRLTTLSDQVRILCSGSAADTSSLDRTPMEFMTTPVNFLEVIGDNALGRWNTNAYRIEVTNTSGLYNQYASHVRFYNVQIMVKVTSGVDVQCFRLSTQNNDESAGEPLHIFKNCIARKDPTSTSGTVRGFYDSTTPTGIGALYRINCIAYGGMSIGYGSAWDATHLINYNCLAYGSSRNYEDPQAAYNCAAVLGSAVDFNGIGSTGNNNASSDSTAFGTGSKVNQNFSATFVDAANGDFHLNAADTVLKDAGATNPGSGLYLDDMDGVVRSGTWDIGPDEYAVAAGIDLNVAMIDEAWIGGSLI